MEKKHRILIAEDDYAIALALKTILTNNFDCELTMASNGQEALEKALQGNFDLILSDWNMPIRTGCQFLWDLKQNEKTRDIPFLMLTARADKDSVVKAATAGVTDYVHKPFDRQLLIKKIEGLFA